MNTSEVKGILFDLDGTLIDTAPDFFRVLNKHRARYGREPLPFDIVRQTVSEGARALVKLGFDIEENATDFEPLRQEFLGLYLEQICIDSCLFPGFDAILSELENRGLKWGIVTNKPRLYSEPLLAALGLSERMAVLVCPDDVKHTKPNPEPLLKAASDIGLKAEDLWYVGDHRRDIEAGQAAGMRTIAAAFGYVPVNDDVELWNADHIIRTAEDLRQLLSLNY